MGQALDARYGPAVDSVEELTFRKVTIRVVPFLFVCYLAAYLDRVNVGFAKLLNFLRMERWIADRPDHPGEAMRQWFKDFYQDNKLIRGELELGGRKVNLRNITMPVLNIHATGDTVVPISCSKNVGTYFGSNDYTEASVPGGHIGTFVGAKSQNILVPTLAQWFKARG